MTRPTTQAPDRETYLDLCSQLLALPVKKGSAKDARFRRFLVHLQSEIRAGLDPDKALEQLMQEAARPVS
jgi:hypothetical protein